MPRRVARSVVFLVLLYVAGTAAVALWVRGAVHEAAWSVMESTAQLVGYEIASAIQRPMTSDLDDEERRHELLGSVIELCRRSTTVRFATVVGRDGDILASNDPDAVDRVFPAPAELFGSDRRMRIRAVAAEALGAGHFIVDFPLGGDGPVEGYVSMFLTSEAIATLYRKAYLTVVVVMIGGVLVLAAMALTLHLQFRRRQQAMVDMLDRLAMGEASAGGAAGGDGAAEPAMAAVDRVGRRLRDARLKTSEARERLARLGEVLDVGIVILEPDGRADFTGARARRLLDGSSRGLEQVATAAATSPTSTFSLDLRLDDGRTREIECSTVPIGDDRSSGLLLQLRDREQIHALERDLMEAARLRSLNRLYVGVTHDLKAPINAMVLNLEALRIGLGDLREVDPAAADRQEEGLAVLARELDTLRRGLTDLLDQTAPPTHRISEFDLAETLRGAVQLLSAQARQQRIEIFVSVPGDGPRVRGNRDAIRQAVVNVLVNALEAMPDGGTLDVRLRAEPDRTEIAVRDTGPGIPAAVSDRLFEMHVSTKATGTGIGLYLARSTMAAHGGTLEVAATGPEGTTFVLGLPRVRGDDADA